MHWSAKCLSGWRVLVLTVLAVFPAVGWTQTSASAPSPVRVVRVGVVTDSFPYSFRDTDGKLRGFAGDIMQGTAQAMALDLEPVVGTTEEIRAAFRDGRVDVLQNYAQMPERE